MRTAYTVALNPIGQGSVFLHDSLFKASKARNIIRRTFKLNVELYKIQVPDELYKPGYSISSSDVISTKIM